MDRPYFVGLTGGSASGKSRFLRDLLAAFSPEQVCLVAQDNYYHPREAQPVDERGVANFDTPQSVDAAALARDLSRLREGQAVELPEYTFNNPARQPRMLTFRPAPVVVIEGLFVLYYPEVADQLDLKLFVDAPEHLRLKRRILRDGEERGYDLADVLYRYEHHVAPSYARYIAPLRDTADLIIPNTGDYSRALSVVTTFLRAQVNG